MRNNDSRFIFQIGIQIANNVFFGTGIYSTQAVIKNNKARIFY